MANLTVSKFLRDDYEISPFILGAFFSRYDNDTSKKNFIATSSYKSSKFLPIAEYENSKQAYLRKLHKKSKFWQQKGIKFELTLEDDKNISKDKFYQALLRKIVLCHWFSDAKLNKDKKDFLRGFFETRGSIDTKLKFITQDYFYNSTLEIRKIRYLIDNFNIPSNIINLNFRELQAQFVNNENRRNTQLRLNLFWYLKNIGLLNKYKADIVANVYGLKYNKVGEVYYFNCETPNIKEIMINERLDFYENFIYDKNLSDFEITNLRAKLKFDYEAQAEIFKRDSRIIRLARASSNICACCNKKYDIADRSFKMKNSDFYYTEIHHVISVGKNAELDVFDNLSVLCPTCHRALGRGKADEKYQKELIENILYSNKENLEFAKVIFESEDMTYLIDKIWKNLN